MMMLLPGTAADAILYQSLQHMRSSSYPACPFCLQDAMLLQLNSQPVCLWSLLGTAYIDCTSFPVPCNQTLHGCRGLQAAVDGLRGEGPLVSVQLDVRNDVPLETQQTPTPAGSSTPDPPAKPEGPMTGPLTKSLSRSVFSPDRRRGTVGTPPSDSVLPFKGMGLLARLGFCRRPFSDDEGEVTVAPKSAPPPIQAAPYVRIRIKVSCNVSQHTTPQHWASSAALTCMLAFMAVP